MSAHISDKDMAYRKLHNDNKSILIAFDIEDITLITNIIC